MRSWGSCLANPGPVAIIVLLAVGAGGCVTGGQDPSGGGWEPPTGGRPPSYDRIVEQYNANLGGFESLWSTVSVSLSWNDDGRRRREGGGGQLALHVDGRMSLTVGKAGHDGLRAGCNRQLYWMFELHTDPTVLQFGRHEGRGVETGLAFVVQPRDVIFLLGLEKLQPPSGRVEWFGRHQAIVEPDGKRYRLVIDRKTARPARIDLIAADGHSRVSAVLDRYRPLEIEGNGAVTVPTRITIRDLRHGGEIRMSLSDPVGDPEALRPSWFNLDLLRKALKPQVVIDLDEMD